MEYGEALDYATRLQTDLDSIPVESTRHRFLALESQTPEYTEALTKFQEFVTVMTVTVEPTAEAPQFVELSSEEEVTLDEKIALLDKSVAQAMPERPKTTEEIRAQAIGDEFVALLSRPLKDTHSKKRHRNPAIQHERAVETKLKTLLPELISDPLLFIMFASVVDEQIPYRSGNVFRDKLPQITNRMLDEYMAEHWRDFSEETLYAYTKVLARIGDMYQPNMVTEVLKKYFEAPKTFEELIEPFYTYAHAMLTHGINDHPAVVDAFVDTLGARNGIITIDSKSSAMMAVGPLLGMYDMDFCIKANHVYTIVQQIIRAFGRNNMAAIEPTTAQRERSSHMIIDYREQCIAKLRAAGWDESIIKLCDPLDVFNPTKIKSSLLVDGVELLQVAAFEGDAAVKAVLENIRQKLGNDLTNAFFFGRDPLVSLFDETVADIPVSINVTSKLHERLGGPAAMIPLILPNNLVAELRFDKTLEELGERVGIDAVMTKLAFDLQKHQDALLAVDQEITAAEHEGINYYNRRVDLQYSIDDAEEISLMRITVRRLRKIDDLFLHPLSHLAYEPFPDDGTNNLNEALSAQAQEIVRSPRGVNMRGIKFTLQHEQFKKRGLQTVIIRRSSVDDPQRVYVQLQTREHQQLEFDLVNYELPEAVEGLLVNRKSANTLIHYLQKLILIWSNHPVIETSAGTINEGEGDPVGGGFLRFLGFKDDGSPKNFQELQASLCLRERRLDLAAESRKRALQDPEGRNSTYVRIFDATGMRWKPIEVLEPQPDFNTR